MQSKKLFKSCEGIWCSSFYVKEFDVIIRKKISLYNPIIFFYILYPGMLWTKLVVLGGNLA